MVDELLMHIVSKPQINKIQTCDGKSFNQTHNIQIGCDVLKSI